MTSDPEQIVCEIDGLADDFKQSPDIPTAEKLEKLLTKFKMYIGAYAFDQLPMYVRLEGNVERYLNRADLEAQSDDGVFVDTLRCKNLDDLTL